MPVLVLGSARGNWLGPGLEDSSPKKDTMAYGLLGIAFSKRSCMVQKGVVGNCLGLPVPYLFHAFTY